MLDHHPAVHVVRESHWIPKMFEFFGTGIGPAHVLTEIVLRTEHVTGEAAFPAGPAVLGDLFVQDELIGVAAYCDRIGMALAESAGKRDWADKTPDYGAYMSMLQTLWPDCLFVNVIRDGVEVASSMARHPGYRWLAAAGESWWVPVSYNGYYRVITATDRSLQTYGDLWARRLLRIRDEATRIRRGTYLEVRFERLTARPAESLARICRFLQLEAPDRWMASAAAMVDPALIRSVRTPEGSGGQSRDTVRLLMELGYPV
jgi:hypothetical protein